MEFEVSRSISIAATALIVCGAALALIACGTSDPGSGTAEAPQTPRQDPEKEPRSGQGGAEVVDPVTYDDLLVEIGRRVPGFGGLFRDPDNSTVTIVYLQDPSDAEAAETAITDILGPEFLRGTSIRIEVPEFEIADLERWHKELSPRAFGIPGVVMTDMDEGQNRVEIGINDPAAEPEVRALAESLGIPGAALVFTPSNVGQALPGRLP